MSACSLKMVVTPKPTSGRASSTCPQLTLSSGYACLTRARCHTATFETSRLLRYLHHLHVIACLHIPPPHPPPISAVQVSQKVDGAYADAAMKFVIMSVAAASDEALEGAESDAEALLESGMPTEVDVGDAAIAPSSSACYELHFDVQSHESTYDIDTTGVDYIAIFTEHVSTFVEVEHEPESDPCQA